MRIALAALTLAAAGVAAPTAAFAQDYGVEERIERKVIIREPAEERVIVREPRERIVVEPKVRRYVIEGRRPSVTYERRVVIGDTLPDSVETYEVPDSNYGYVVLNGERYVVDRDRRIVDEIDD